MVSSSQAARAYGRNPDAPPSAATLGFLSRGISPHEEAQFHRSPALFAFRDFRHFLHFNYSADPQSFTKYGAY